MLDKVHKIMNLGRTVITLGVQYRMCQQLLNRHQSHDWGDVDAEDRATNDYALKNNQRILSVYKLTEDLTIWIITEWDRSVTTILLPEEY